MRPIPERHSAGSPSTGSPSTPIWRTTLFLILLLFLPGCQDAPSPEGGTLPSVEAEPMADAPTPTDLSRGIEGGRMAEEISPLAPLFESGVTGEVIAMAADDALVLIVELEGLSSEGAVPARVHTGECSDDGPMRLELEPVMGLADGTGISTTTLEPDDLTLGHTHSVRVYGTGNTTLACGLLKLPSPPDSETGTRTAADTEPAAGGP